MNGFLFHEFVHLFLTGLVAGCFFWHYRDWRLIAVAFFFGIFIDIDHLFDYFVEFGFDFRLWRFFDASEYIKPEGTVYVLFHGWEFIFVFAVVSYLIGRKFKIKGLVLTVILAYGLHLFWDHVSFAHHWLSYSFIYRAWFNFGKIAFEAIQF